MNREHKRLTEKKIKKQKDWFSFKALYKRLQDDHGLDPTKANIMAINGQRNIGKTTYTFEDVEPDISPDRKIVVIRNNDAQLRAFVGDLKGRWAGRFIIQANIIYNVTTVINTGPEGEEVISYVKNEVVGYCVAVSTYLTYKSMMFNDVKWIIHEEYNQAMNSPGVYAKWVNLITTITRFSNTQIIMIGNREDANNEFMVSFGIEPQDHYDEETITKFGFSGRGYFIELGKDDYRGLKNEDTLAFELSQLSSATKEQGQGGYQRDFSRMVLNYDRKIKSTFTPICAIVMGGEKYFYGKFTQGYAIINEGNDVFNTNKSISLDNISDHQRGTRVITSEDRFKILEQLTWKYKELLLYFTSFDDKNKFDLMIRAVQLNTK